MARMGVDDALIKAGCRSGDEVRILGYSFDFEGIEDDFEEDSFDDVELDLEADPFDQVEGSDEDVEA